MNANVSESPKKGQAPQRKSDGQDGPPVLAAAAATVANTPGAPNAALKEAPPSADEGVNPNHPAAAHLRVVDCARGILGTADGSPRRKKIAICGFASSTRSYILEISKDPAWEVWCLNQLYRHIPRADVMFDIHWNWDQEVVPGTDHRRWAQECGIPFYTIRPQRDLPTNVVYPIDAILQAHEADYFTSTIAYELALALHEIESRVRADLAAVVAKMPKAKIVATDLLALVRELYGQYTVALFGIDLTVGSEYFQEKPCAEYWIGAMSKLNIQMMIPPESALCKQQFRYGYERTPQSLVKAAEIQEHAQVMVEKRMELLKQLCMIEGVLEADTMWAEKLLLRERGTRA